MVSELIKTAREKLDIFQDKLAIAISVANVTISFWETGKSTPPRSTCERLSNYCEKMGIDKELVEAIREIL